jgi:hypothetical protein
MEDDDFDPLSLAVPERVETLSFSDEYGEELLGLNFGSALQLDNNTNYLSPSSPSSPRTSRSRQSTRSSNGALGDSPAMGSRRFFVEGTSSPMLSGRSSGASSSDGGTRSLASELADATPDRPASRDLLWELGLEEGGDEEDGLGDEGGYDSDEQEGEYGGAGDDTVRYEESMVGSSRGGSTGSGSRLFEEGEGGWTSPSERSTDLLRDLSRDAPLDEMASLEAAFESTTLLAHLSPATTSSSTSPNPLLVDLKDQQPLIESLASTLVRTMYESAKDRERQVQELSVLERLLVKNEVGWREALSELVELPLEDHEERLPAKDDPMDPISTSTDDPPLSVRDELASLQSLTSSLISSLSTLHESTQVQKADTTKASHQLRSLRTHVSNYTDESMSLEQSEEFIREYESGGREKGEYARAVGRIVRDVEEELSKGWERAKEVLVV